MKDESYSIQEIEAALRLLDAAGLYAPLVGKLRRRRQAGAPLEAPEEAPEEL